MYVASIRIDGTQPTVEDPTEHETAQEAWAYLAERMREEADEMYPEKEPDEVAVAEIMASPAYWNLSASRSMQEQAAKFFLSHGFGLDGTGSLLADGLVYTVEPVTPRNQEVQS